MQNILTHDVAVIIPLYNGARWIGRTLASVQAQTQPPREVVVVDDGSDDRSRALVQERPGVTLLRNPTQGANAARRVGYEHTTAPLVAFLDQDDAWHPEHLRTLCDVLRRHPEAPAAVADVHHFEHDRHLSFPASRKKAGPVDPWKHFPYGSIATPSAVLLRRTALEGMGGWPTRFVGVADHYTWLRLSTAHALQTSGRTTVGYRQHSTSHSATLRARNGRSYLQSLSEASADALAHRIARGAEDTAALRQRQALLVPMQDLIEAIDASDWDRLRAAAQALEHMLEEAPPVFRGTVCRQLLWFLKPAVVSNPSVRRVTLRALYVHWPESAPRLGRAVRAAAEEAWPWDVFLRASTDWRHGHWWTAGRVLVSRVRRHLHVRRLFS
ncbi:MAG: glycosyltransferase family 2 protein [Salinibacter sp.]